MDSNYTNIEPTLQFIIESEKQSAEKKKKNSADGYASTQTYCVALTLKKEIGGVCIEPWQEGEGGGDIIFMIYPLVHLGLDYLDAFLIQNKYFKCKKVCGEDRVWSLAAGHRGTKEGG